MKALPGQSRRERALTGQSKRDRALTGQSKRERALTGQSKRERALPGQTKWERALPGEKNNNRERGLCQDKRRGGRALSGQKKSGYVRHTGAREGGVVRWGGVTLTKDELGMGLTGTKMRRGWGYNKGGGGVAGTREGGDLPGTQKWWMGSLP